MPDSRFPPIAIALLLIACICIYGIILLPGTTFAGMDFLNLNYPRAVLTKEAYSQGVIPLWNWYEWGGAPLLAALQGAVLYPPTWLALLLPLPYGLQAFVFAHLMAAAFGAYLVARHVIKVPAPVALLAGIMFMGGSFFPGRIEQFQIIAVNCLLPWLILATYAAARSRRHFLLLPFVWALTLLAGHPQYAVFNLLASLLLVFLAYPWRRWPYPGRTVVAIVAGLALGTGLAAAQLLPTWELGQLSERIWPYPEPTTPELHWKHLPAIVIPKYYNLLTGETGRVFGFTELGLYIGIVALPLAITALFLHRRQPRRQRRLLLATSILWLLAMIFALGQNAYLATFFFEYMPFFTQTRGAARSLNVASLMLALLAAQGLTALTARIASFSLAKRLAFALGIAVVTCADLAISHFAGLKSVLTTTFTLNASPLPVGTHAPTGRLYRFMAFDSDLYLNNSPAAVAERFVRLQPNLSSVMHMPLTDGYEEGLLPTRTYANLQRKYNRNLRSASPDAALLAFLGSGTMLTEYPLEPDSNWSPASPAYPRPPVVPSTIAPSPATYWYWQSAYTPAVALDAANLTSGQNLHEFFENCARVFPITQSDRTPTQLDEQPHLLQSISPAQFTRAAGNFSSQLTWNRLAVKAPNSTTSALVLVRPYPGWKLDKTQSADFSLKALCSLFYTVDVGSRNGNLNSIDLVFAPYSFQLGLFISLVSMFIFGTFFVQVRSPHQIRRKVFHEHR